MEKIDSKIIWREAANAALLFGAVSGGCSILNLAISDFIAQHSWVSTAIWMAKLVGLIWLMRLCMARLSGAYEGVTGREKFVFGRRIALISAAITAALSYIGSEILFPEVMVSQFNAIYESMGSMLDSNSLASIQKIEENMGPVVLLSNFIWCWLYGTVLSAILSGARRSSNPFDNDDDI